MRKLPKTPDTLAGIKTEIRLLNLEQQINTEQLDHTLRVIAFGLFLLLQSKGLVKLSNYKSDRDGIQFEFDTICKQKNDQ